MLFNSTLSVAPSQVSQIKRIPPQRAFKRILYFLTAGLVSDKLEEQTFTAVSILQQFYNAFASLGIHNLVRLAHNDLDFYLDAQGRGQDLKETLDRYDLETNEAMSKGFEQLRMVLEHEQGGFKYLIHLTINRSHELGKHPIDLYVDGLLLDFRGDQPEALRQKMQEQVFKSQETYNSFLLSKQAEFEQFISKLAYELKRAMDIKQLDQQHHKQILLPRQNAQAQPNYRPVANDRHHQPVHHHYHGSDVDMAYLFLWTDLCHQNSIQVSQVQMLSDSGEMLGEIGNMGIDAGENSLFDPSLDFESRLEGLFGEDTMNPNSSAGGEESSSDSSSSWGSWFGLGESNDSGQDSSGDSGSDSGGDSGSSCSSCSSCGSCGGGGD